MISANKKIGDLAVADQLFPNALAARFRHMSGSGPVKTSTAATTASSRWAPVPEKRVIRITGSLH
ncbi:MAG TPA: hypothetical protein VER58_15760 [Thermoanaerobaculia bacterium]|nr:hypothetical protein [Thermoanaerobaculia bacterium]